MMADVFVQGGSIGFCDRDLGANIARTWKVSTLLRENLLIFPCVLFGAYLFVDFHI